MAAAPSFRLAFGDSKLTGRSALSICVSQASSPLGHSISALRTAEGARETRDRILAATMELHARHGVVNVSHKDVAAAADVSVGTVYHHFPTRAELVQAGGARSAEVLIAPPSAIHPQAPLAERIAALAEPIFARLGALGATTIANMHGSSWRGAAARSGEMLRQFERRINGVSVAA